MTQTQPLPDTVTRNVVRSLSLSHFRNYHSARVEAESGPVLLIGPNGAGKTNILEAISLLTPGRGLRRTKLAELDNMQDAQPWAVAAEITGPMGESMIGTGRDAENTDTDKRVVRIDGKTSKGQSELVRYFSALWLTPQMDTLFIEGGTARRKFLDRLVYSFDAEHASRLNAYEFSMRERNRLLQAGRAEPAWISALEHKMAEQAVAITAQRQHTIEGLTNAMHLAQDSFPQAQLTLGGAVEKLLSENAAVTAEEKFRALLEANRQQDGFSGRCQAGVHRSEISVRHMEKNLPAESCSTGEQKILLLSIVLAQARAGALWHGLIPVLLFDEAATHLDARHRQHLFAELEHLRAQAWLTGTDKEIFEGISGQFLWINSGTIKA